MLFDRKQPAVLAIFVFLFLLSPLSSYAQKDSVQFAFPRFSFQLRVVDLFQFGDFQGASVSFKYHFGDKSALRVGVGIATDTRQSTFSTLQVETDSISALNKRGGNSKNFVIFTQYIIYPNPDDDIKFYFGAGPFGSWRVNTLDRSDLDDSTGVVKLTQKDKIDYKSVGLDFVVGVEWFFMKSMSLLADYNFSIEYYESTLTTTKYLNDSTLKRTSKSSLTQVGTGTVKVGLSIYL